MAVGPIAAASLLLGSIIGEKVNHSENTSLYLHLFFTAAFFSGVFQLALGFFRRETVNSTIIRSGYLLLYYFISGFRLGMIVDFLSRPTILGFMGGTAIIVILQQLKGMLGLQHFTNKTSIISVVQSIISQRDHVRISLSLSLSLSFGRRDE